MEPAAAPAMDTRTHTFTRLRRRLESEAPAALRAASAQP